MTVCSEDFLVATEFCDSTAYFNPTSRLVEWDGTSDAMINLNQTHILKDDYPIANIDRWIAKKPKHAQGIALKVANIYVRFLRKNQHKVRDTAELEVLFRTWLRKNHPWVFYSFSVASWFKSEKDEETLESVT